MVEYSVKDNPFILGVFGRWPLMPLIVVPFSIEIFLAGLAIDLADDGRRRYRARRQKVGGR